MLAIMSFKYYFIAFIFSIVYQKFQIKMPRKNILFIINTLVIGMLYFTSKKHFVFLICHITLVFSFCKALQKLPQKTILFPFSIFIIFAPLIFYKFTYLQNFITQNLTFSKMFINSSSFLGLSFYTFKISSVVIDIRYGRIKDQINFLHLCNYALFFPCLLSGPLDRFSRFITDVDNDKNITWEIRYNAICRIVWGIFKKVIIADIFKNFSNDLYNASELYHLPIWKIFVGQYGYYLMLYFDFSGYCDIAIGFSNLFGIFTPENFNSPWKARNIQIFWNSWHITFMNWLRDYIFYPLQSLLLQFGVKNIPINNSISYLVVFVIAGLWHGVESHFLYYGIFHGVGFMTYFTYKNILEKILTKEQRKAYLKNKYIGLVSTIITFHFFLISLFFFIGKQEFFSILLKRIF